MPHAVRRSSSKYLSWTRGRGGVAAVLGSTLIMAVLVGCGGDSGGSGSSGSGSGGGNEAESTGYQTEPVPVADITFVPGIADWILDGPSDSTLGPGGTTETAYARGNDYINVTMNNQDPVKEGDAKYGWYCAAGTEATSCFRGLADGNLTLTCYDCPLDAEELNELAATFYTAFTGGGNAGAPAPEEPCKGVDLDAVAAAFGDLVAGPLEIDTADSAAGASYQCELLVPGEGFGESDVQLQLLRHNYDHADLMGYAGDCDYGGTSPGEVYESALSCFTMTDNADTEYGTGVTSETAGAGGFVAARGSAVRADGGDYWWEANLFNVTFNSDHLDELIAIARTLPTG